MVFGEAVAKEFEALFRGVDEAEEVHVAGRDDAGVRHGLEIENAVPVFASVDGDENFLGQLLRLRQREDFKKLVEGAEATGEDYQTFREIGEPEFAHEEIVKLKIQRGRDVGVGVLLK